MVVRKGGAGRRRKFAGASPGLHPVDQNASPWQLGPKKDQPHKQSDRKPHQAGCKKHGDFHTGSGVAFNRLSGNASRGSLETCTVSRSPVSSSMHVTNLPAPGARFRTRTRRLRFGWSDGPSTMVNVFIIEGPPREFSRISPAGMRENRSGQIESMSRMRRCSHEGVARLSISS